MVSRIVVCSFDVIHIPYTSVTRIRIRVDILAYFTYFTHVDIRTTLLIRPCLSFLFNDTLAQLATAGNPLCFHPVVWRGKNVKKRKALAE